MERWHMGHGKKQISVVINFGGDHVTLQLGLGLGLGG